VGESEGTDRFPDASPVDEAEWRLTVSEGDRDPYRLSVTGLLELTGEHGALVVRARYRKDPERLEEGVVREERGFWTGDDEPDAGDVPSATNVSEWRTEAASPSEFLTVCESALTTDVEGTYEERLG